MTELEPFQFLSKIWPSPLLTNETLELKAICRKNGAVSRTFSRSINEFIERANSYSAGWDIYFGISTRFQNGGKKQDCYRVSYVWVDLDKTDKLPDFKKIEPSIIVKSGGGFHCYWLLDSPVVVRTGHIKEIEAVNRGLCTKFYGDKMAIDITRVLRVPGFNNYKYTPARKVTAHEYQSIQRAGNL
jgi:putative DNA primase/helicase